jgi:hypothetical protein
MKSFELNQILSDFAISNVSETQLDEIREDQTNFQIDEFIIHHKHDGSNIYKAMDVLDNLSQLKNEESWTDQQEHILNVWADKAVTYRMLHIQACEYYRFINNLLTYPIILLSTVLGMGGFAIITYKKPTHAEIIIAYIMAACNFIVALLSSIQKVMRCSENSEQHLLASVEYVKFNREIQMELVVDRGSRVYSIDFCRDIKHQYNKLTAISPPLPPHICKAFELKSKINDMNC